MATKSRPDFTQEQRCWQAGHRHVAGIDEAGRGALAGPVVAAAVIPPYTASLSGIWAEVCDSKQLLAHQREALAEQIKAEATAWGVGMVDAATIDQIGIAAATREAMRQAILGLTPAADFLLLDWVKLPQVNLPQHSQSKADQTMVSVAAASILAKVHRDQHMLELHQQYPVYQFAAHKGYGTAAHRAAIRQYGPCPIHRLSFAPLAQQPTLWTLAALPRTSPE
jgi:ribonuclease HII